MGVLNNRSTQRFVNLGGCFNGNARSSESKCSEIFGSSYCTIFDPLSVWLEAHCIVKINAKVFTGTLWRYQNSVQGDVKKYVLPVKRY